MDILGRPIDYETLEGELQDAIRADELYKLQNDAKIRAIEQRVPTYDNFKDMVNAAHLRPIDRSNMKPNYGVKWNSIATSGSKPQLTHCLHTMAVPTTCQFQLPPSKGPCPEDDIPDKAPKTAEEFLQVWKRLTNSKKKFAYLLSVRPVSFIEIFRTEIPLGVLGEVIDLCLKNLPEGDDVNTVIDILTALSHCNRFQLSVNFMTQEEKEISRQLFQRLLARGRAGDGAAELTVNMLRKRYQVKFD